jgi:TonB-dependent SusC/RagA subfamily outer membrane receptor
VGDEIVLTGIVGVSRRVDAVTSSYQIIKHEEINQAANENAVQALAGKVSGLQINTTSDGKTKSIVLRGSRSITGNNEALIIIDGTISTANHLQTLNSNLILEMRVIKGAEGAALYGEKGGNGVIVVTTKKGFEGLSNVKTRTNFNETAFFYPNLKTDKEGKISFEFKTPESLTRWNFRLYAHNKNAETGYFQTDIISQKDVMVQTNMPRFVREKDEIKISAKVVNITSEIKTGIAMLQLYDATTNTVIDEICSNKDNVKNFSCKAKESVPVEWIIKIPEGLQGLQYKIVAKSGNFSDGEENILPVLSNKVLLTESIPIWVKGETKKEYEFLNLKNNSSKTLKNHLFTLEYTSNPTWLALQSLPYLMEYEHECAEQTFSRYYANYIATQIIDSNPKVASLFETWKQEGNLTSKLNMNEELKSIVLAETPWLLDAQNEESKNKRLALLMDLNTMKESMESTLKKLKEKQNPSGAFSWFDGGEDNLYITQHIVKGLGHLGKLFPEKDSIYNSVAEKAIPYLDQKYISNSSLKNQRINYYTYSNLHYLYARSFYVEKQPVSKNIDSIINIQKVEFKKDWLTYNLYSKALLALTMHRFGDKAFAKKILTSLKESAARNEDNGMYWIENTNGYYWYQSSIETQAMLIEAFAEIENDDKIVDELKVWLLKNKQVNKWSSTKSTTEAVYALLLEGSDWTSLKDNTKFTIGNEKIFTKKLSEKDKEAETGYIKLNWKADEITKEMGTIKVDNKSKVPGYGGVYWQYFENLENIKTDSTKTLYITKTLYKKVKTSKGNELIELNKESLKTGDLITIRLVLKTESDLEFMHLKDLRASCFEPVDVISNYEWRDNLSYYKSTKDVATHFFFDKINKGTYVLEYDVRTNNSGNFNDGIATLQSMYAPEFSAHSTSTTIKVD